MELSSKYAFGCRCRKCAKGYSEPGEILTGNSLHDTSIRNAKANLHALFDALLDGSQTSDDAEAEVLEFCNVRYSGKP